MKRIAGIALLAFIASAFADTFLATLKITQQKAEQAVWSSFWDGTYEGPLSASWHSIAAPTQVALIKEIGAFAKRYTLSEDFKRRYLEAREERKPSALDPFMPMSALRKMQHDALVKQIESVTASLTGLSADMRKQMEAPINDLKNQLKNVDDPANPIYDAKAEARNKRQREEDEQEYKDKVAKWEKEWPTSSNALIKDRLQQFLTVSATVDFAAQLKPGPGGMKVFVKQEYQEQDDDWKIMYRAGKQCTDAARAVATQWLTEIK